MGLCTVLLGHAHAPARPLFMWQVDITGVAHFVMDCLDVLDDIPSNQP